jgi:aminopeptidase-like protein
MLHTFIISEAILDLRRSNLMVMTYSRDHDADIKNTHIHARMHAQSEINGTFNYDVCLVFEGYWLTCLPLIQDTRVKIRPRTINF